MQLFARDNTQYSFEPLKYKMKLSKFSVNLYLMSSVNHSKNNWGELLYSSEITDQIIIIIEVFLAGIQLLEERERIYQERF